MVWRPKKNFSVSSLKTTSPLFSDISATYDGTDYYYLTTNSMLNCQQTCRNVGKNCVYFVYNCYTSGCHLKKVKGNRVYDFYCISGPPIC